MGVREVKRIVGDTPHMSLAQAKKITRFIREHRCENILELGFKHGVSTCYMASTLGELGRGSIVTIDLTSAQSLTPNVEALLERIGERTRVEVYYEPTSYTWRLMKMLEEDPSPRFDLCYLDGAHTWFVDALAFFLVDRLLRPGGWIIFDDLQWSFERSPTLRDTNFVKALPTDERKTPQVERIYELLVKTHPSYQQFRVDDDWGFAQKAETVAARARDQRRAAPLGRLSSSFRSWQAFLSSRVKLG